MHYDRSAPIAQLVELLPLKEKVPGSSPGGGTSKNTPPKSHDRNNDFWEGCFCYFISGLALIDVLYYNNKR